MSEELTKRENLWQTCYLVSLREENTTDMAIASANAALAAFDEAFKDETPLAKLHDMGLFWEVFFGHSMQIKATFERRADLEKATAYLTALGFKGTWQ